MTPDSINSWLSPAALLLAILLGASMISLSVRTGWLTKSIVWSLVVYGGVGAVLLMSPKWTTIALEYKDFKTQISQLEDEKSILQTTVSSLQDQIAKVAELNSLDNATAKQALATIDRARETVGWAKFLPATNNGIRIAVPSNDQIMMNSVSADLSIPESDIARILASKKYTLLQTVSEADLSKLPPSSLWFNPSDKKQ
ncbi:hypothetical protein CQ062_08490 [Ochrobactrum sp. MYb68]|nr:hypothetical protein CQ062_08490 [Ochrobactrum sp. MYb68]